jgi:hypothetical protein
VFIHRVVRQKNVVFRSLSLRLGPGQRHFPVALPHPRLFQIADLLEDLQVAELAFQLVEQFDARLAHLADDRGLAQGQTRGDDLGIANRLATAASIDPLPLDAIHRAPVQVLVHEAREQQP